MLAVVARAFLVAVVAGCWQWLLFLVAVVAGCWQWLLFLVAIVARAFLVAVVAILGGSSC